MVKSTVYFLLILLLSSAIANDEGRESDLAVVISAGTEAVAIETTKPVYPGEALTRDIEGWVVVNYVINQDGSTEDIRILDTSREGYFEKASIQAVERWKFNPATWNGVPATQAKNISRLVFQLRENGSGVSRFFKKRYKKAITAIDNEELENAKGLIAELDEKPQRYLAENYYLDYLKGLYWLSKQNPEKALRHFERALLVVNLSGVPQEGHIILLRETIRLNITQANYAEVLDHYEELLKVDPELKPNDPISENVAKIKQFIESESPYITEGAITKPCLYCETVAPVWIHSLLRNQFTIKEVEGEVNELKLLCGFKFVSLAFEPNIMWNVAKDWGDCSLLVLGTEGTTFKLVEL